MNVTVPSAMISKAAVAMMNVTEMAVMISRAVMINSQNPLKMERKLLYRRTLFVPRSKHSISFTKSIS